MQLTMEEPIDHIGLFTPNILLGADAENVRRSFSPPETPIDYDAETPLDFGYLSPDHFGISPFGRKYVHMIGAIKGSRSFCKLLGRRLLADYPEYYYRIIRYFGRDQAEEGRGPVSLREKAIGLPREKIFIKTHSL